jgi:hypothetical protein
MQVVRCASYHLCFTTECRILTLHFITCNSFCLSGYIVRTEQCHSLSSLLILFLSFSILFIQYSMVGPFEWRRNSATDRSIRQTLKVDFLNQKSLQTDKLNYFRTAFGKILDYAFGALCDYKVCSIVTTQHNLV